MSKEFIKQEKGSVLPLVALFMVFVAFGIIALVVDVGTLYNTRREMVTAADAGALAGAMEMEKTMNANISANKRAEIRSEALKKAETLAEKNGASGNAEAKFDTITVQLGGSDTSVREVIVVNVYKNEKHDFAQLIGLESTNVVAEATATWGVVKEVTGGQIFPLFMLQKPYDEGETVLHGGKLELEDGSISYPNRGFIRLGEGETGKNVIRNALSGTNLEKQFTFQQILESETGEGQLIIGAVETRMKEAAKLDTKEARKQYMSGLIPIVTSEVGDDLEDNNGDLKAHLNLTIKEFAVYVIHDVIVSEGNNVNKKATGSEFALFPPNYTKVSTPQIYETDYVKGTILGVFTGETVELYTNIKDGDQIPIPFPETDEDNESGIPTYSKLVK